MDRQQLRNLIFRAWFANESGLVTPATMKKKDTGYIFEAISTELLANVSDDCPSTNRLEVFNTLEWLILDLERVREALIHPERYADGPVVPESLEGDGTLSESLTVQPVTIYTLQCNYTSGERCTSLHATAQDVLEQLRDCTGNLDCDPADLVTYPDESPLTVEWIERQCLGNGAFLFFPGSSSHAWIEKKAYALPLHIPN